MALLGYRVNLNATYTIGWVLVSSSQYAQQTQSYAEIPGMRALSSTSSLKFGEIRADPADGPACNQLATQATWMQLPVLNYNTFPVTFFHFLLQIDTSGYYLE